MRLGVSGPQRSRSGGGGSRPRAASVGAHPAAAAACAATDAPAMEVLLAEVAALLPGCCGVAAGVWPAGEWREGDAPAVVASGSLAPFAASAGVTLWTGPTTSAAFVAGVAAAAARQQQQQQQQQLQLTPRSMRNGGGTSGGSGGSGGCCDRPLIADSADFPSSASTFSDWAALRAAGACFRPKAGCSPPCRRSAQPLLTGHIHKIGASRGPLVTVRLPGGACVLGFLTVAFPSRRAHRAAGACACRPSLTLGGSAVFVFLRSD